MGTKNHRNGFLLTRALPQSGSGAAKLGSLSASSGVQKNCSSSPRLVPPPLDPLAVEVVIYFSIAHGLAWGVRGPLMGALRADYFGRKSFPTIMGFSSVIVVVGSVSGPIVAGVLADLLGDYRLGFSILAALAALGSVFFLFASKPQPVSNKMAENL